MSRTCFKGTLLLNTLIKINLKLPVPLGHLGELFLRSARMRTVSFTRICCCCPAPCLVWWSGSLTQFYFLLISTDYCISQWFSVWVSVATAFVLFPPSPPIYLFFFPPLLFPFALWSIRSKWRLRRSKSLRVCPVREVHYSTAT